MSKHLNRLIQTALLVAGAGLFSTVATADALKIGGTGAAMEALRLSSETISARTGGKVEIVPNLGSSGAIRAVQDGILDLCVSGRPLKAEETARGLFVPMELRTPYILVTSHRRPNGLGKAEIAQIYSDVRSTWADKVPISLILRPRSDSDTPHMGELFPGMAAALETARKRPEVITAATDHDNLDAAERVPGSLTGMTYLQFKAEKPNLRIVPIDGVAPSFESFEAGTYTYSKALYFIVGPELSPSGKQFIAFLRSPEGQEALRAAGAQVSDKAQPR